MGTWDSYCPNCFSEKNDGKQQCHSCGYDEGESRSPAALPARTILNNQYVVGRVLGSPGGFGITYLCWDIKLATCVAIKEFMPRDNAVRDRDQCSVVAHSGKDREFFEYGLKAFLAEARTVAGFDHPNIVKVRYFFEQNHTAYLVMDYYKGVSLAEYVKQKGGRLPEKVALGITRFVLDGLRHVHDSGYLHRDVKPANIYLTGKGQVILLDFGAARYAMGEHSRSLSVVVTAGFSPFEQYSTKGKQGPWTDIYASGATLYYMLTGNLPESAPDRVLSDTLADPLQLLPDLPPSINKGIMLALRVKASDRPQSIEELKKILSGSQQPVSAVNIKKTVEKSDKKEKRWKAKKPAIPVWRKKKAIAIGICLLVLLTIVYGDWGRLEKVSSEKKVVPAEQSEYVPQEKTVEIVVARETTVAITGPKIGDVWNDPVTGMEFVWVPEGSFDMGSPQSESGRFGNEGPVHRVELDGFWLGRYEVTNAQYRKWKSDYSSGDYKGISLNGNTQPVVRVSWEEAREFAAWLSGQNGGKYTFSLPSEAQWEYACRAGTKTARYWGDNPDQACQYANVGDQSCKAQWSDWPILTHNCTDSFKVTAPVGSFRPNSFELYDMLGNVFEWCEDVYIADVYSRSDRKNPIYTSGGPYRVLRGGSWFFEPDRVRCAYRHNYDPSVRLIYDGFRLMRML
jgi:formylglycine-generating enzyme required for sulfatase activity/serine/threonine protein kinase